MSDLLVRITWYERPNELSNLQYTLPYEIELKTLIYGYIFWQVRAIMRA
jgi:hypothetical protein